jgi:hypothetical protein
MYLYVRSTSQESEWSCICMLGVDVRRERVNMYLYVRSTSQESEWSSMCMLGVQARRVSGHVFV